jgi:hypothetical protein
MAENTRSFSERFQANGHHTITKTARNERYISKYPHVGRWLKRRRKGWWSRRLITPATIRVVIEE